MITDFIKEDPETLAHVLDVIAGHRYFKSPLDPRSRC